VLFHEVGKSDSHLSLITIINYYYYICACAEESVSGVVENDCPCYFAKLMRVIRCW
jgi:hypothetical protein